MSLRRCFENRFCFLKLKRFGRKTTTVDTVQSAVLSNTTLQLQQVGNITVHTFRSVQVRIFISDQNRSSNLGCDRTEEIFKMTLCGLFILPKRKLQLKRRVCKNVLKKQTASCQCRSYVLFECFITTKKLLHLAAYVQNIMHANSVGPIKAFNFYHI